MFWTWSLSLKFLHQYPVCTSPLSHSSCEGQNNLDYWMAVSFTFSTHSSFTIIPSDICGHRRAVREVFHRILLVSPLRMNPPMLHTRTNWSDTDAPTLCSRSHWKCL
jgi:hypothetical protein